VKTVRKSNAKVKAQRLAEAEAAAEKVKEEMEASGKDIADVDLKADINLLSRETNKLIDDNEIVYVCFAGPDKETTEVKIHEERSKELFFVLTLACFASLLAPLKQGEDGCLGRERGNLQDRNQGLLLRQARRTEGEGGVEGFEALRTPLREDRREDGE